MLSVEIREDEFSSAEELQAYLAARLGFPNYYGANLSALSDCLEDIARPTRIRVERALPGLRHAWLDGFLRVMARCAIASEALLLIVDE